jgi:phosphatidylglycerophosphatase A
VGDLLKALAVTCFGLGASPLVPGTAGTLGGVAIFLLLPREGSFRLFALAFAGLAGALCVGLGPWAERRYGRKDPPPVVLDEVAGFLVTALGTNGPSVRAAAASFVLFRALDVLKPPPARWLERLPRGWGVLLDDVAAGAMGGALLFAANAAGAADL